MDPIESRLQRLEEQVRRTQRALDELRSAGVFHIREHSAIVESLSASALVATNASKVLVSAAAPALVSWVPITTQSVALMTQVVRARYYISDSEVSGSAGKVVHIWCKLVVLESGTGGNAIKITGWPAAINPAWSGLYHTLGHFGVYDNGSRAYVYPAVWDSASIQAFDNVTANVLGVNPNIALAANDEIYLSATWEID